MDQRLLDRVGPGCARPPVATIGVFGWERPPESVHKMTLLVTRCEPPRVVLVCRSGF